MKKIFFALVLLIVLMLFAGFLSQTRQSRAVPPHAPVPAGEIVIDGIYTCLSHRDVEGPQTLECALGLAGDDGNNYSLDLGANAFEMLGDIGVGERVRIEGTVTPVEALSTDMWWKYDMSGIITVRSIVRI
jgi:hypothetical protein